MFVFNENDSIPDNDSKNKHGTSAHDESHESSHEDIVPTRFPDKNIKFNSDLSAPTSHALNPSAMLFCPQNHYELPCFIEKCSCNDEKHTDCMNEHANIDMMIGMTKHAIIMNFPLHRRMREA